jgi:hypothetical protein
MLFNRDSAIQKCFQKILYSLQGRKLGSLSAFQTTCHTVRTPICPKHHSPDDVTYLTDSHLFKASSVRTTRNPLLTFLYVEKFRTAPIYIRPDVSATLLDDTQCSPKLQDFFPKPRYGKIATVQTTWIPVRTHSSIR